MDSDAFYCLLYTSLYLKNCNCRHYLLPTHSSVCRGRTGCHPPSFRLMGGAARAGVVLTIGWMGRSSRRPAPALRHMTQPIMAAGARLPWPAAPQGCCRCCF